MPAQNLGNTFVTAAFTEEKPNGGDVRDNVTTKWICPALQVSMEGHSIPCVGRHLVRHEDRDVVLFRELLRAIELKTLNSKKSKCGIMNTEGRNAKEPREELRQLLLAFCDLAATRVVHAEVTHGAVDDEQSEASVTLE